MGKEGWLYFRFCVMYVLCESPYIAFSALSFQDCVGRASRLIFSLGPEISKLVMLGAM